jgi:hypothetical protein
MSHQFPFREHQAGQPTSRCNTLKSTQRLQRCQCQIALSPVWRIERPPPLFRPRRYMTKFPSNWVIPPNELLVPVPRAQGGTTDAEVQVNIETAVLPTDSSAPALPVPDRIESTQSRFDYTLNHRLNIGASASGEDLADPSSTIRLTRLS